MRSCLILFCAAVCALPGCAGSAEDGTEPVTESVPSAEREIPVCTGADPNPPRDCRQSLDFTGSGYCYHWTPCGPEKPAESAAGAHPMLLLSPEPELWEATVAAAYRYWARGVLVAVGPGGIPVSQVDSLSAGQGLAHYGSWCHGADCNDGHGVWIHIVAGLDARLANSLDHEIAHVLSGWGACVPRGSAQMADDMHLTRGHIVSNGNDGYAAMVWTAEDQALIESCVSR